MNLFAVLVLFSLLVVLAEKYVVIVAEGRTCTIRFNTNSSNNLTDYTIEVKKDNKTVFARRDGEELPDMDEYKGRVYIDAAALERGVVILYFNNVSPADHGKYRIYFPGLNISFFFNMEVQPNSTGEDLTTMTPKKIKVAEGTKWKYLYLLLLLLLLLIPLFVLAWRKRKNIQKLLVKVLQEVQVPKCMAFNTDQEEVNLPLNGRRLTAGGPPPPPPDHQERSPSA